MSIIETQENPNQEQVDMYEIMDDVRNNVLSNVHLIYKIRDLGENIWSISIRMPNGARRARIEIIIDEYANPEDRGARGAVFTYGSVPRDYVNTIMDAIMERI